MEISLNDMAELARALVDADAEVVNAENELKEAKERARLLREETIPCAMQELGLESLKLDTGQTLKVAQEVYASIPNSEKPRAYAWLDENGFGGLIKINLSTQYGKGEKDSAVELFRELQERGLSVDLNQNVHHSTLKAFLKEQLKKGADIPLDVFGARPVWSAKISK